jgi:hypothetical protein
VRIFHFPVRSSAQFKRRTEIAIFEGRFPDWGRFRRLREQFEEGRLEELYAELLWDDDAVEAGIRDGQLVRDERLALLLPNCPDPIGGTPPGSVRVEPQPGELQREETELEFDAMHLLGRTERWLIVQRERAREQQERVTRQRDIARRRVEELRVRLAAQREKVQTLRHNLRLQRARPWNRLRRAAGRLLGR